MTGQYTIDNLDMYSAFGWVNSGGNESFLQMWERKEPYSHDWGDENGIEVDLNNVYFKPKKVYLEGTLRASDEKDFWTKYTALFQRLAMPGLRRLFSSELQRSFFVYYTDCSAFDRLTRIRSQTGNYVYCRMRINFMEPIPSLFQQYTYLTTINGQYLVTPSGQRIRI